MKKSMWILALVWVLVLLAPPVFAGHAFSDPMRTTGGGDLYVLGGLDVDGTCQLDGAVTFTAGMTGDDLTLSGTLTVGGAFTVTDSTYLAGPLTITGALEGGRLLITIGSQVTNQTVDKYLKGAGGWSHDANNGYIMHRTGSIVGASFNYVIDSYTPVASVNMEVRVNDAVVYDFTDTLDGTGSRSLYGTQARGTDTFAVGDVLTAKIDVTGTLQYDYPGGFIEVVFDD